MEAVCSSFHNRENISSPAATMSSVQGLREFIKERLTAAAGEIFTVFEQTILQYEEEIDRQRKLLEISWKPQIRLSKAELPQGHVCEDGQLFSQGSTLTLDQEPSVPAQMNVGPEETQTPRIKQEQEEPQPLHSDGQREAEPPPTSQESRYSTIHEQVEDVCPRQEAEQPVLKLESDAFMVACIERSFLSVPEADDEQLLTHDAADILEEGPHMDSGSTGPEDLEPTRVCHSGDMENSAVSQMFSQRQKRHSHEEKPVLVFGTQLFLHNRSSNTNVKLYTCEVCGKTCNRKTNLLVHMRTHTGEKPYCCQMCGKSFKYQHYFLIHKRNHTGETPFTCNSCGKKFTNSSSLIKHRKIHTDKKHVCVTCGKSFTRKPHMLNHMRTHTGDQACYCAVCGKGFSSQSSLMVHVRQHAGENSYYSREALQKLSFTE